ncbi:hypothetical protein EVJ58_g2763 [Rhodofomes roseus]|uniref:DNA 3'-5' helicase n=1 Tax=Rhodofomes roseus TaxID=34475 RepID=A0A4Y9YR29_9APHY|nr:hypothetical protein EVJ58_g2763 [Rhodofomes roseus]
MAFSRADLYAKANHDLRHNLARQNLERARKKATEERGYDSARTRRIMATQLHARSNGKMTVREWQLNDAEAIVLGLDSSVIAGTGAGKTIPYMLPLLLPEFASKILVVVSPLKSLQRDQMRRFRRMGIEACAVNGDTWSERLRKDLLSAKYRAVFTSPEMCLEHPACRETMTQLGLSDRICAWVIDEAHCISQWGGDFRPTYDKLDELRAIVHGRTPIIALSATLTPSVLEEVETKTHIDPMTSYHVNLGNDRPNIKQVVIEMKSKDDFDVLNMVLEPDSISAPSDIPKTLIFANTRNATMQIWRHICEMLDGRVDKECFDFLHAYRRRRGRERVMQRFLEGKIRILVATEAAGMGADIPDIERVVQFGVPSSLTVWIQRAGRAGRSPDIEAIAILLVEKSAFQLIAKRRKKRAPDKVRHAGGLDPPEQTYKMNVEAAIRAWLETKECRRGVVDEYFNNPPRVPAAVVASRCCDNCAARALEVEAPPLPPLPLTPSRTPPHPTSHVSSDFTAPSVRALLSPSAIVNTASIDPLLTPTQGRRKRRRADSINSVETPTKKRRTRVRPDLSNIDNNAMTTLAPHRAGKRYDAAMTALMNWRSKTVLSPRYANFPITEHGLLTDEQLKKLVYHANLETLEDINKLVCSPPWALSKRHGLEVLEILRDVDNAFAKPVNKGKGVGKENGPATPRGHRAADRCSDAIAVPCNPNGPSDHGYRDALDIAPSRRGTLPSPVTIAFQSARTQRHLRTATIATNQYNTLVIC